MTGESGHPSQLRHPLNPQAPVLVSGLPIVPLGTQPSLHAAVTSAVPGVVRPRLPGAMGPARFGLYWRVIEIRDAMLVLAPYSDPRAAAGRAAPEGLGSHAAGAAWAEARLLASAVEAKRAGGLPRPATQAVTPIGAIGLRAEAQWLAAVSNAYTRVRGGGAAGRCGAA
jgi:uncharacterized protein DUF6545